MPRTFVLRDEIVVKAPIGRCFALSTNLEIVARTLKMRPAMDRKGGCVQRGDRVRWRGWQLGLPQLHESLIDPFIPPVYFRDSMVAGRFTQFAHDHHFAQISDGVVRLFDEVRFQLPLGFAGEWVGRWVLVPHIRRLLRRRFELLKSLAEGEEWRTYVAEEVTAD